MDPATENWRTRRDIKLYNMLDPEEPAWMVSDTVDPDNETAYYAVVHRWAGEGWSLRRYTYDMVADVIHFRGTSPLDDAEIAKMKDDQRIVHHSQPR